MIHAGSTDQQNIVKHNLLKHLHSFEMTKSEDVSQYHSRFQILCDRIKASKVKMDDLDPSLAFIHGVDSRFSTTKRITLMSAESQKLSVAELARKFELEQRYQASTSKSKDQEANGTALKLEKVLKEMEHNQPICESKDHELVLMSTMVKHFLSNKGKKPTYQAKKKEPKDVTCYNCQGKGHFAKDCKKEKVERPQKEDKRPAKEEKWAFITAWGDSDNESEGSEPGCLMENDGGNSDCESEVKVTDLKPDLLERDDLVALSQFLIEENATYNEHLEDLENETNKLKSEMHFLKMQLGDREFS